MPRLSNRATVVIGALVAAVIGALTVGVTSADAAKYSLKAPRGLTISQTSPTTAKTTWTAVKKAPRYRVQLSTRSNMSGAVYARSTGKTASRVLNGLKASTTYYVKVRVITTHGANRSPYSKPTSFKTAKTGASITKILVFVEENHSLSQMKTGMPYSYSLAKKYGYASNFTAIQHPSLPNYIALAAGDTLKVNDDKTPPGHLLNATTVFGQAIAGGKTAKTYADGMPANCHLANGGDRYVPRHNPWTYFVNERDLCDAFDVPFAPHFAADAAVGALPNVGMVIPNKCNDAHDCSLATADKWFKARMKTVFASADWKSGRLVVVLTADEDDKKSGNKVLTAVIHPSQKGNVVRTPLTMHSLSQLISNVSHTTPLLKASKAPSMRSAFQLPID